MMNIIYVGYAATEAVHRLILNEKPALRCRFSDRFINNAFKETTKTLIPRDRLNTVINSSGIVINESDILELSDMGIFGGLWEFAEQEGCGLKIHLDKINIRQETIEICEYLNVNPYTYPSQGSWLIRTDKAYELADFINSYSFFKDDSETERVDNKSIDLIASVIGSQTADNDRIIINQTEIRYLTPVSRLLSDEQDIRNLRYI